MGSSVLAGLHQNGRSTGYVSGQHPLRFVSEFNREPSGVLADIWSIHDLRASQPVERVEARASAFGIPHHAFLADSDGTLAYQIGPAQVLLGGKFFAFKTSPKGEEYVKGTMAGALVGLRWTIRE